MRSSSGMLPRVGAVGEAFTTELRLVARLCRRSGHALFLALSASYAGIRDGWRLMTAYETLDRLSADDLARRGLRREGIPRAVLAAQHRRDDGRRLRR